MTTFVDAQFDVRSTACKLRFEGAGLSQRVELVRIRSDVKQVRVGGVVIALLEIARNTSAYTDSAPHKIRVREDEAIIECYCLRETEQEDPQFLLMLAPLALHFIS